MYSTEYLLTLAFCDEELLLLIGMGFSRQSSLQFFGISNFY